MYAECKGGDINPSGFALIYTRYCLGECDKMSIGKRLLELRKAKGLTQSELGQMLSITAQAISKWENESSEPDFDTVKKLAEIYGVSVASIVDPEGTEEVEAEDKPEDKPEDAPLTPAEFDVYLTEIGKSKITTINYIINMLGIELAEAKRGVESLPYLISGGLSREAAERVVAYLAEVGAIATIEPGKVGSLKREIFTTEKPKKPEGGKTMNTRFISANITAAIPGILVAVLGCIFLVKNPIVDIPTFIYFGISIYSLIFLLWYPSLTKKLLSPIGAIVEAADGFFKTLGAIILMIPMLLWIVVVALISPIIYAFSIKGCIEEL